MSSTVTNCTYKTAQYNSTFPAHTSSADPVNPGLDTSRTRARQAWIPTVLSRSEAAVMHPSIFELKLLDPVWVVVVAGLEMQRFLLTLGRCLVAAEYFYREAPVVSWACRLNP